MLRRVVRLTSIVGLGVALLAMAVAAASHIWPAAIKIWRLDLDQSAHGTYTAEFVGVLHGWMWAAQSPGPTLKPPFRQVDRTISLIALPGDMPSRKWQWSLWIWSLGLFAIAVCGICQSSPRIVAIDRPIARRLMHAVTAVTIALLLFVTAFAVRSVWRFERLDLAVPLFRGSEALQLNSSGGSLMIAWTRAGPNHTLDRGGFAFVRSMDLPYAGPLYQEARLTGNYEQAFGFTLGNDGGSTLPRNVLIAPYWAIVLALAGVIALCVRTLRRLGDRDAADRCKRCGYDCRGLAERCPECGTAIAAARS